MSNWQRRPFMRTSAVSAIVDGRRRNVGSFEVRRVLPSRAFRLVGPFIFLDHMGPLALPPGEGIDVWPHPHIGLATVTYLLDGELIHRDSLGSQQSIQPGAINWMTAGRGIVHSERSGPEARRSESNFHGLQLWVALPTADEEIAPAFHHYAAESLPSIHRDGSTIRVLIGSAYGTESPVHTLSPVFFIDVVMPAGGALEIPDLYAERAAYVVDGAVTADAERVAAGKMLVVTTGTNPVLRAESDTRLVLLGGAPTDGPRHIWWNFVSSSPERIDQAKRDWKEHRFPLVPGDETDFTPLPYYS
jgi:redox-sensitive bicupin YhaK (pirin superfamily)